MNIRKKVFIASAMMVLTLTTVPTFALGVNSHANAEATQVTSTESQTNGSTSDPGSQAGSKLADAKLKSCQNREHAINNILSRIVTRGQNQLTLFNTIAQRVETFKTSKSLTVSNYDQLLATLQADQTKATNDLTAMKTNETLDCSSTDPKGMVTAFQSNLKTEISDLQTYRTDVKDLIVAVKTSVGTSTNTTSSNDNTGSNTSSTGGN